MLKSEHSWLHPASQTHEQNVGLWPDVFFFDAGIFGELATQVHRTGLKSNSHVSEKEALVELHNSASLTTLEQCQ